MLLWPVVISGCADLVILPPAHSVQTPANVERHLLQYGGGQIEVFAAGSLGARHSTPRAFVLRFSGGDAAIAAEFTASRWRDRPVEVWCANYPGYGDSEAPRSLGAMTPAALALYDHVATISAGRPIFVEGFSLGTVPALALAARRPVAGVILQNPPPLKQLLPGHYGWWNLWLLAYPVSLQIPSELDSITNASNCRARAVLLLAEDDRTIPLPYQRWIADAFAGDKRIIVQKGAGHYTPLTDSEEAQLQSEMDWLLTP